MSTKEVKGDPAVHGGVRKDNEEGAKKTMAFRAPKFVRNFTKKIDQWGKKDENQGTVKALKITGIVLGILAALTVVTVVGIAIGFHGDFDKFGQIVKGGFDRGVEWLNDTAGPAMRDFFTQNLGQPLYVYIAIAGGSLVLGIALGILFKYLHGRKAEGAPDAADLKDEGTDAGKPSIDGGDENRSVIEGSEDSKSAEGKKSEKEEEKREEKVEESEKETKSEEKHEEKRKKQTKKKLKEQKRRKQRKKPNPQRKSEVVRRVRIHHLIRRSKEPTF
jgi:hypothetical protein